MNKGKSAGHLKDESFLRKYPEGWNNFRAHLITVLEEGRRRHRSLLGVFEIPPERALATERELLDQHGFSDWDFYDFDVVEGRREKRNDEVHDGGFVLILQ